MDKTQRFIIIEGLKDTLAKIEEAVRDNEKITICTNTDNVEVKRLINKVNICEYTTLPLYYLKKYAPMRIKIKSLCYKSILSMYWWKDPYDAKPRIKWLKKRIRIEEKKNKVS